MKHHIHLGPHTCWNVWRLTAQQRSHLRIVREVEAIGGNVTASASLEQMGYTYDAMKTYVPEMVEMLIDCVRNPAFLDWEINDQENFTAPRMVLAASGIEHEELLKIAEPLLSDLPSQPHPQEPESVYVRGDYHCQVDSGPPEAGLSRRRL
ncbi:Mitochondrial-processing peptidase subunit alpha like [Actinidia chinensis var. chinensis]|uniref:Mitochondrial-processing peptidase subunit alpha like n=1 Tax=Actinidia chinensis var. chinensis TaxID=1590841 RepID=A0A2R6S1H7_ACTCC|nr:Mitochondrial-processing peptidase subunit alpha like [Actinidia chinensis var. chinensis]